jgi:hypothetical protein
MGFDPSTVRQSLHVLTSGLEVAMDDDVVRMREGQHMVLEIERLFATTTTKGEWGMTLDGERAEGNSAESKLCEMRLLFQGRYAVGDASSERFFS